MNSQRDSAQLEMPLEGSCPEGPKQADKVRPFWNVPSRSQDLLGLVRSTRCKLSSSMSSLSRGSLAVRSELCSSTTLVYSCAPLSSKKHGGVSVAVRVLSD
jgi:hypothetical protein